MKTNFNQHITYLKRGVIVFSFFIFPFLQAQIPTSSENYVLSVELLEPMSSVPSNLNSVPEAHKKVSIVYFDDLGREKQIILHKGTPERKDIVTQFEYDGFGRQVKDYLPAPTTQINGAFIPDLTYAYTSHYGSFPYNTALYYSEKELENSALNRLVKQGAPGEDWGLESGHAIAFKHSSNSAVEVDLYWIDGNGNLKKGGHSLGDKYPAKALRRSMITDENGNSTFEFQDKQGRIVLKRSKVEVEAKDPGPGTPVYENADTHYVYDIYGNLRYVIPPNAASVIPSGTVSSELLKDLCYTYKYDQYNRLIERRLPGKGWEYLVYDKQNRLVATQDANLRADGKWLFTKYDKFGRVVYTGIYAGGTNRGTVQTAANNAGSNNEKREPTLKFTKNGLGVYYTSTAFPTSFTELLSVNYYDTYTNLGFNALDQFEMQPVKNGNEQTNNLKGYPVASFLRALGTSTWEKNFTVYDKKTRVVGVYKSNHLGGFTKTESELDFRGKPQNTEIVHKRNATGVEIKVKDFFEYDHMERLVRHSQSINNYTTKNLIALNQYDKLGQLQNKKVGGTDLTGTNRWQKIDYSYNIRGWLTHINNPLELIAGENTTPPAPNDDLFAFQIRYNDPTGETQPLYNGNISQTTWKTASDNTQRGYNYTYDRLNRLRRADFYKQGAGNITAYGEFISYDLNGNITHLTRTTGDANDNEIEMDDLNYTYDKDGLSNLLVNVSDAVTTGSTEGFKDGNTDPNLDDYEYDTNGNMIKDRNKGISNITYNHLNLPTQIEFEGTNNKITYLYNSVGQKLKKTVVYSDSIKIVDYLDGFQYTGEVLQFFPHAEGYVKATPTDILNTNYGYNYVFNYTDHLGNIRVSYSKDPRTNQLKILEENHYYPFGLKHSVYTGGRLRDFDVDFSNPEEEKIFLTPVTKTEYQYKYNGKEFQDELGLNWTAMDFRNYDAAIGRFVTIDPLAELSQEWTTYKFAYNNPVYWRDPSGLIEFTYDKDGTTVTGYTGSESEMAAAADYFANNEGASLNDFESYVWNSMDAGEGIFAIELGEATITAPSTGEQMFNYATDQISPILEGAQVVGGTLINGLYGIVAALVITIDEATWTEPADEQRVRMRMRNLQLPIPMKIHGFRNGRWDYHDFENMSSEQQQDYVMKLLIKNGTMALPTLKFLKNAPPGLNETIQSTLIEQATSEWLDSLE